MSGSKPEVRAMIVMRLQQRGPVTAGSLTELRDVLDLPVSVSPGQIKRALNSLYYGSSAISLVRPKCYYGVLTGPYRVALKAE